MRFFRLRLSILRLSTLLAGAFLTLSSGTQFAAGQSVSRQSVSRQSVSHQSVLCQHLRSLTQGPAMLSAHWGISVTTLTGTPVCSLNEAQLFRPASNAKLFTTAAAFALLGPESAVATRVLGSLDLATGTVAGDLILAGAGDGNLDSGDLPYLPPSQRPNPSPPFHFRDLEDLAAQLAAGGVKSIAGDVVGDDTLFPDERYPPSWNADDLVWGYGAPVSALSVADNQLQLTVTPGQATGTAEHPAFTPATVTLDQHGVPFYTVEAEVETRPKGSAAGIGVEWLQPPRQEPMANLTDEQPGQSPDKPTARQPGARDLRVFVCSLRVFGSVTTGAPDTEEIAIADPALYAAMAFRDALLRQGIAVTGTARARHAPVREGAGFLAQLHAPDHEAAQDVSTLNASSGQGTRAADDPARLTVLATHKSAPLAEDVAFTQKTSQNLHAELLLRRLGLQANAAQGSNIAGVRTVRAFLLQAGVLPDDFVLYDGSGLSDHDLVTPRSLTHLLRFASTQPWFAAWRRTLPVGGVDGSLAARFTGPLRGRVQAKTGTLGESRALSGYLTTAAGQTLCFSILVDTHLPGSNADRAVMDRMVELIASEP